MLLKHLKDMLLFYINISRSSREINVNIHATKCMLSFETFCFPLSLHLKTEQEKQQGFLLLSLRPGSVVFSRMSQSLTAIGSDKL